jgi:hypothetical protein
VEKRSKKKKKKETRKKRSGGWRLGHKYTWSMKSQGRRHPSTSQG